MSEKNARVVNVDEAEEHVHIKGRWGGTYRILTPSMRPSGGKLGVNLTRVPPGMACVPFHFHMLEDEVFYILSGRGVLRYGDELTDLRAGDCISCPAGSRVAHQIANPYDEDLTYLAMGNHDPDEVCFYPDNGKTMVRFLKKVGFHSEAPYMEGEPEVPAIFQLIDDRDASGD